MRAGEASATAQRVAAQRLRFDRAPAPYGDPDADDVLARDVAGSVSVPDDGPMVDYLRARTTFFDRLVVGAIDQGVRQVVVAAAGYDGRALRYRDHGIRWFEVDHPDTQRDKRERLDRLGLDSSHIAFVAADFVTDPVADGLVAAGFDRDHVSLILVEGVAAYLARPVLASLLHQLRSVAADGSRLAISLSTTSTRPGSEERRAAFLATVASYGEPAMATLTVDGATHLLRKSGWAAAPVGPGREDAFERARAAGFTVLAPA